MFYSLYIAFIMLFFPILCIIIEKSRWQSQSSLYELIGKWFIFWGIGIRLTTAGFSQVMNPSLTAGILHIDPSAMIVIQELGLANILFGIIGVVSLKVSSIRWVATSGGFLMGMAGILHLSRITSETSFKENIAMISDLWIFAIVLIYLYLNMNVREIVR
ncbi:MAG TPA: hypothetical protein PKC30_12390 [Saprospiraceae bacterium]|nr:hypothetical protein [Saprospiraceae bacterium]